MLGATAHLPLKKVTANGIHSYNSADDHLVLWCLECPDIRL